MIGLLPVGETSRLRVQIPSGPLTIKGETQVSPILVRRNSFRIAALPQFVKRIVWGFTPSLKFAPKFEGARSRAL